MSVFKTGWKGKTRGGHDAEVIKDDLKCGNETHQLAVVYTEKDGRQWVHAIHSDGRYYGMKDNSYNLIDEPEYLEGWVNMYSVRGGLGGIVHKTKKDADDVAHGALRHSCVYIRVPYHKGDGLEEK